MISRNPAGIGGSVVECSPATRAARVRFPADAFVALYRYQIMLQDSYRYMYKDTDQIVNVLLIPSQQKLPHTRPTAPDLKAGVCAA